MNIDNFVVNWHSVVRGYDVSGNSCVHWDCVGRYCVYRGNVVGCNCVMLNGNRVSCYNFGILCIMMHSLSGMVRLFMNRFIVMDDLVVGREVTDVSIIVIHLEDEVTILDVNLAGHEQ